MPFFLLDNFVLLFLCGAAARGMGTAHGFSPALLPLVFFPDLHLPRMHEQNTAFSQLGAFSWKRATLVETIPAQTPDEVGVIIAVMTDDAKKKVDPEFIARVAATPPRRRGIGPPEEYDVQRVIQDLERLQNQPDRFWKYAERVRQWFDRKQDIAALEYWIRYYSKSAVLVKSTTELERAKFERSQVLGEAEIEGNKKIRMLKKLEADIAEQELRAAKARHALENLGQPPAVDIEAKPSPDEKKFGESRSKLHLDFKWELEKSLGTRVAGLEVLDRWKEEEVRKVLDNRKLSPEDQKERIDWIDYLYAKQKKVIMGGEPESIFEDEH